MLGQKSKVQNSIYIIPIFVLKKWFIFLDMHQTFLEGYKEKLGLPLGRVHRVWRGREINFLLHIL